MTEVESDGPTLPDVLRRIGLHDHLCLIYESPEERLNVPVRSIQMGLGRGEKCIYVADVNTVGEVIDTLRAVGTDIDAAVKSKFRNLGIVLVLVVVLVLGALAFCAGKDPICPAIILFR
jgi:hypothetical protein